MQPPVKCNKTSTEMFSWWPFVLKAGGAHSLSPVLLLTIFCFIKQVFFKVRCPPSGAGWFPKQEFAFVWPVINCEWMFLSCAAHMLSLSQADEWLWPLFIITTWLEEIMTGMFLQASLYARYWSQSPFSATHCVKSKKGTFLKHALYFAPCRTESSCSIFSESHL